MNWQSSWSLKKNVEDFYAYAVERIAYNYEHTGMVLDTPEEAANLFAAVAKHPAFKKVEIHDEFGKYAVIGYFKDPPKNKGE